MCHYAVYHLDNNTKSNHGPLFQKWYKIGVAKVFGKNEPPHRYEYICPICNQTDQYSRKNKNYVCKNCKPPKLVLNTDYGKLDLEE